MRNKPSSCSGCPLETKGIGFAPPVGPKNSPLVFVGEALGRVEAQTGIPFSGPSGALLDRLLKRVGLDRGEVRIANCVSCQPPNDWLDGAPWEAEALAHCRPNLEAVLEEDHRAVVALGGSATRALLSLPRKGHIQENWHGCPIPLPDSNPNTQAGWVVPTFHPAFLLRGNQKLIGTVCYDIQKAIHACKADYKPSKVSLVVDPPVEWFKEWVDAFCDSRDSVWLAVDIETTGKAVNEGEQKPIGVYEDQIIRINFSCNPDEGITVPFLGQYLPLIGRLLHSGHPLCFWNARFDVPRLEAAGFSPAPVLDFMWGWHVLQSDLPRGLGFVAPFYSDVGPWKHLSGTDPGTYAAIDAVQTIRLAFGITNDLLKSNQFDVFLRHVCEMDEKVLHPAEKVGLKVDLEKLETFRLSLQKKEDALAARISELVPEEVCPVKEWKRRPEDEQAAPVRVLDLAGCCRSCGAVEVARTHRCRDRSLQPRWEIREAEVTRWRKRLPFNPSSNKQLLGYIQSKGWKGGKAKKAKTDEPSVDRKTVQDLIRRTHDPVLPLVLEHRQIGKVLGTYVEGTYRRLGYVQFGDGTFKPQHPSDGRVHPQFLHKPSTLRLSCVAPNLTNIITDRDGAEAPAAGFRGCLVAEDGCVLIEADYSAIEAVETGWFAGDPDYIRLAKLGVHAYLASHLIGRPADLKWSDENLGGYFKELKKSHKQDYDRAKRVVHGTNYGLTPIGMVNNYPDLFSRESATRTQALYFDLCPKLQRWQKSLRDLAHRQNYLGGRDHPFGYRHWFWSVYVYNSRTRAWTLGEDSKRVVAFYPQSTSAGVIKEAALGLMDPSGPNYIGDVFSGKTPIRALVHDSILVEVPKGRKDEVVEKMWRQMTLPITVQPCPKDWAIGTHLSLGVAVKYGTDWQKMDEIDLKEVGVGSDTRVVDEEEEEE